MRREFTTPAYGQERRITKFLILPLDISTNGRRGSQTVQRRWFERVTIEQKFTKGRCGDFWKNIRFV